MYGLADMYQDYIDGRREINMEFKAGYESVNTKIHCG